MFQMRLDVRQGFLCLIYRGDGVGVALVRSKLSLGGNVLFRTNYPCENPVFPMTMARRRMDASVQRDFGSETKRFWIFIAPDQGTDSEF